MILFLLKGILSGLLLSIPVGPVGFLCVRRTLAYGKKAGFVSGLGAITSDLLYSSVILFSITTILNFLQDYQIWIRYFGAVILLYVGMRIILNKHANMHEIDIGENSNFGYYVSTFIMTLTNPIQILTFTAIFTALGAVTHNYTSIVIFIVGLILGASLWWGGLVVVMDKIRHRITEKIDDQISRIAGIFIFSVGMLTLASFLVK